MATDLRAWCKLLREHKGIRVLCNDWTAFEYALSDLVKSEIVNTPPNEDEAKATLDNVEDA